MRMPHQGIAPALALFLLAPLVGEYLFGNVSIDAVAMLLIFAPLYGGGALLIREIARRSGGGWPTIIVLALSYGLIEEGLLTQLLFNPSYSTYGVALTGPTYIPVLTINAAMTLSVLTLHTVWSICVPIAIIEALFPGRSSAPWLGGIGLSITGFAFLLGSAYVAYGVYVEERFLASILQLTGTAALSIVLISVAPRLRQRNPRRVGGRAPDPWLVGVLSLAATTILMFLNVWTLGRFLTRAGAAANWAAVAVWVVLVAAVAFAIGRWSAREGWGAAHRLALASGALLTYACVAFPQTPIVGSTGSIDLVGNIVFFVAAVVLIATAANSLRQQRGIQAPP